MAFFTDEQIADIVWVFMRHDARIKTNIDSIMAIEIAEIRSLSEFLSDIDSGASVKKQNGKGFLKVSYNKWVTIS